MYKSFNVQPHFHWKPKQERDYRQLPPLHEKSGERKEKETVSLATAEEMSVGAAATAAAV